MPTISANQIIAILQASKIVPPPMLESISNLLINTPESNLQEELIAANLLPPECIDQLQHILEDLEKHFTKATTRRVMPESEDEISSFMLSDERKKDLLFASQLLTENLCKVEDINKCLLEQTEIKNKTGKSLILGQIMVRNHYIPVDRFVKIHREIEKKLKETGWEALLPKEKRLKIAFQNGIIKLLETNLPEKFGPYRILEEVARGGMGVVYKAWDPKLKRPVALKVLKAWENPPMEEVQRFRREARLAATLNHPNIVRIYDAGSEDGVNYFTMDFVEGETLSHYLMRGSNNIQEKLVIIREIALALDYAHIQGIIHRDVKPGNIILDLSKHALLTDFGLAKGINTLDSHRLTKSGEAIGTPSYMSPEQARGSLDMDARSDIYSLGAVLYEMLTGRPPFDGSNVGEVISAVIYKEPILPSKLQPDLHSHLETICLKAIAKNPAHRYQTAKAMADDIDSFLRGDEIKAKASPLLQQIRNRMQRVLISILILVCCIPLLLLVYFYWESKGIYKKAQENYERSKHWLEKGNDLAAIVSLQEASIHPKVREEVRSLGEATKAKLFRAGTQLLQEYQKQREILYQTQTKESQRFRIATDIDTKKEALILMQNIKELQAENEQNLWLALQDFWYVLLWDPFHREARQALARAYSFLAEKETRPSIQQDFLPYYHFLKHEKIIPGPPAHSLQIRSEPTGAEIYLFAIADLYQQRMAVPYPLLQTRQNASSAQNDLRAGEKWARFLESSSLVLDEASRMGTTPLSIENLPSGAYIVCLKAKDHLQHHKFITLSSQEVGPIFISLTPQKHFLQGFAPIDLPGEDEKYDYFLSIQEIVCAEYQKFLNDPDTLQKYRQWQSAKKWAYVPRLNNKPLWEMKNGRFVIPQEPQMPVIGISWEDAWEYCRWLNEKSSDKIIYRLPYYKEWQWVAGKVDERKYSWGNEYDPFFALPSLQRKIIKSADCLFDISPYGIYNMGSNVSEWCLDDRDGAIPSAVICGGNWQNTHAESFRIDNISFLPKKYTGDDVGFRVLALVPKK